LLVQRTARPVDEQVTVFVKLDVTRKRHNALLSFGDFQGDLFRIGCQARISDFKSMSRVAAVDHKRLADRKRSEIGTKK
jgi:hypothetical protein